jgi:hypothetical protein
MCALVLTLHFENIHRNSKGGGVLRTPIPGQQLVNALGRVIGQASEHVGEPGLRVWNLVC